MTALGLAARFIHLVAGLGLVGIFAATLLAGRSDRPTAVAWAARMGAFARALAGAALLAGVAVLMHQSAVVAGRAGAALEPAMPLRLLAQSQFGTVWMVRHGLLLLLLAALLLREQERSRADFLAWRAQGWALGAIALAAMAWAGHAAAVEPLGAVALLADGVHVAAAGTWLGALLPLALLLRDASTEPGADARPYAVLAIRRFSALALVLMLIIVSTGLWNAWVEVGGLPALIGTRYGNLLLVKLALLAGVLALAGANRRRLLPALSADGATVGRPAMARLSRLLAGELGLALAIVAVTATLSLTPPAQHESPGWPFATRLSYDAVAPLPGLRARLFIGTQLAVLGLLVVVVGSLVARRRGLVIGAGGLAVIAGAWMALPPLVVDAYPTTYLRSEVPYQATSVVRGMALYATHCAVCHGRAGKGDGPGGGGLPRLPADLTAPHTRQHTAGDLFWWISHGIPRSGMPAFAETLSADERWDLINFLRALSAGEAARALTPRVEAGRPSLVAPDFSYTVGPAPPGALKDLRDRFVALVVFFSLPGSRLRLAELARTYGDLESAGAEVIAIPMDDEPRVLTRLGGNPPMLFPIATEGGADIVSTYRLFSHSAGERGPARHVEFLIDRQGYIRARWLLDGGDTGGGTLAMLREQIGILDREAPSTPPLGEHVH
jgi:putative copper export protein/mono/diheme cytochrome c family protein/peroxiredoxin